MSEPRDAPVAVTINATRVAVLGESVDATPGGGPPNWTDGGPAGSRNVLNPAVTPRIPTLLFNRLVTDISGVDTATSGFDDRFNAVVGSEAPGQPDETAFQSIGSNLIQAIAGLMLGGGAAAPVLFAATPPAPAPGRLYCNTGTGRVYLAGPVGGWFRVF